MNKLFTFSTKIGCTEVLVEGSGKMNKALFAPSERESFVPGFIFVPD